MDQVGARLTLCCDSAFLALAEKEKKTHNSSSWHFVNYETRVL